MWLELGVGWPNKMPSLMPVVKDGNRVQLVVALRHTCGVPEATLASDSDIGHTVVWLCPSSFYSSALSPALPSACLRAPSSVTPEPFPSSYPANCSSLEVGGNSCVCQAAAAVRQKTGPGIWCWATGWCDDFLGQVNSFVSFVPLSPPHFHCTKGKQKTVICLAMWLPLGTRPAICGGPY